MSSNVVVPELGESIVDARVSRWLKKEGERVSAGDPLVELETDKIDLEVGAPQAGVLARIDRRDGEDVKIGEVLGVIEEEGAKDQPASAKASADKPPEKSADKPAAEEPPLERTPVEARQPRSTPSARRVADEHDVKLGTVKGTGDGGRVMRRDVEGALGAAGASGASGAGAPSAPAPSAPSAPAPTMHPHPVHRVHSMHPVHLEYVQKNASGCRSAAPRSPSGSSRRSGPRRCSRPSTRST